MADSETEPSIPQSAAAIPWSGAALSQSGPSLPDDREAFDEYIVRVRTLRPMKRVIRAHVSRKTQRTDVEDIVIRAQIEGIEAVNAARAGVLQPHRRGRLHWGRFDSMLTDCELVHAAERPPLAGRIVVFLFAGAFVLPALAQAGHPRQARSALGFAIAAGVLLLAGLSMSFVDRRIYFDAAKRELILVFRSLLGTKTRNLPLSDVEEIECVWDPNRSGRGWRVWIRLADGERIFYTVTAGSWRVGQPWQDSAPVEAYRRLAEIVGRPMSIRQ